jgi:hypothetical protein
VGEWKSPGLLNEARWVFKHLAGLNVLRAPSWVATSFNVLEMCASVARAGCNRPFPQDKCETGPLPPRTA